MIFRSMKKKWAYKSLDRHHSKFCHACRARFALNLYDAALLGEGTRYRMLNIPSYNQRPSLRRKAHRAKIERFVTTVVCYETEQCYLGQCQKSSVNRCMSGTRETKRCYVSYNLSASLTSTFVAVLG